MYITADCCSQRDKVLVMFSALMYSTFTVQILYKLYSLQLNCTYSNYTEAAATCSAAQQHTNCPADIFWSAVRPAVLNDTCISTYTFSHVVRSDLSNSRYCLRAQCHLFTALHNTPNWSSKATASFCVLWHRNEITFSNMHTNSNDPHLKEHYKKYCKILNVIVLAANKIHYNKLLLKSNNKTKTTWNIVKTITNHKHISNTNNEI